MTIEERLAALEAENHSMKEKLFNGQPLFRPTIINPVLPVYDVDIPLYSWMNAQFVPTIKSFGRLYKVIDNLGSGFITPGDTGSVTDTERTENECADRIDFDVCQQDFKTYRVAIEACIPDDQDVDVPFVTGRDAIPAGSPTTLGEFRDDNAGDAIRQSKDFLLAQGLGNANQESESLETLINQNTTPNIIDNAGQSMFELAVWTLLAQIGLTSNAHSYLQNQGGSNLWVHPLIAMTMAQRMSLANVQDMYSKNAAGQIEMFGIPVREDRNIYVNTDNWFTSIYLLKDGLIGTIEHFPNADKEIRRNEITTNGDMCDDDCLRLFNFITGVVRSVSRMGRVINVKPMLINTIASGHAGNFNNPNVGTKLGGV